MRGFYSEGLIYRREIDWASPIVGRKFTVFALFYFVFECNFQSTSPQGAYIWRGDLTEAFFCVKSLGGFYFLNFTVRVLTKSRNRGKLSLFRFHCSAWFLYFYTFASMLPLAANDTCHPKASISFKLQW